MNDFGIIFYCFVNIFFCVEFYDIIWYDFILFLSFCVYIFKILDLEYLFINVYEIVISVDFIFVVSFYIMLWSGFKFFLICFLNWSVFVVFGSDVIIYYWNIICDLNLLLCLILFFILLLYFGGDKVFLIGW